MNSSLDLSNWKHILHKWTNYNQNLCLDSYKLSRNLADNEHPSSEAIEPKTAECWGLYGENPSSRQTLLLHNRSQRFHTSMSSTAAAATSKIITSSSKNFCVQLTAECNDEWMFQSLTKKLSN